MEKVLARWKKVVMLWEKRVRKGCLVVLFWFSLAGISMNFSDMVKIGLAG